jgi:ribosomal protein L2
VSTESHQQRSDETTSPKETVSSRESSEPSFTTQEEVLPSPKSNSEIHTNLESTLNTSWQLRECTPANISTAARSVSFQLIPAKINIGNVLPINKIPEGTTICNVELYPGDKGQFARTSGTFATIIGHSEDGSKTRVKLPSGVKKTVTGDARAMIGIVAGGGRNEKPILKAARAYYAQKPKRKMWPVVRGVSMNPVEHPHGGGNHQHVGHSTCIARNAPAGQKVGLIAARRTGRLRGGVKAKLEIIAK